MIIRRELPLIAAGLLLITGYTGAEAALKDKYIERKGDNEYVLHVFEQDLNSSASNKTVKKIRYDYTYVQSTDSVTILTTICVPAECGVPISVAVKSCEKTMSQTPELIYVTPIGGKMEFRLRIAITFEEWERMVNCTAPYALDYRFENPKGNVSNFEFCFDKSKWEKVRKDLAQIGNIIRISSGKYRP